KPSLLNETVASLRFLWTSEQTVEIFPHFPRIFPHDYLQIHASFCIRLHEAARVAGGRRWLKPVENRASGGEDGILSQTAAKLLIPVRSNADAGALVGTERRKRRQDATAGSAPVFGCAGS